MSITKVSDQGTIYLLGSGYSINQLSPVERSVINAAQVRLALNKFTAFHEQSGIRPNYTYFIDYHNKHAKEFIQRTINTIKLTGLEKGMTLVLHKNVSGRLYRTKNLAYHLQALNPFNYIHFKRPRFILDYEVKVDFVKIGDFMKLSPWADSFDDELFHYRSSLTSALNYITLKFDPCKIVLVGVDLNKSAYFYQEEIEATQVHDNNKFRAEEKKAGKHFTALDYKGTSMIDNFHLVTASLIDRGFTLVSSNPNSLFAEQGICPYEAIAT